jgi:phage I-like protein
MSQKNQKKLQTCDIKDVEIFSAGTWNGDTYTTSDLEQMVNAFRETKQKIKPYLKLGHESKQHLANSDEMPAVGWIENLKCKGKKLMADFVKVPQKIYELIKSGAYRRVSSEIFWNPTFDGKKYPHVLKGVAILGGATPAVQNLNDILSLYGYRDNSQNEDAKFRTYEVNLNEGEQDMEKELLQAKSDLTNATQELESLKKENEELKTQLEELKNQIQTAEQEKQKERVGTKLDKLVEDGKIVPSQKEKLFVLLTSANSCEKKYTHNGKETTAEELVFSVLEGGVSVPLTTQYTQAGISQDIESQVRSYMKKHNVSYKEAMIALSK